MTEITLTYGGMTIDASPDPKIPIEKFKAFSAQDQPSLDAIVVEAESAINGDLTGEDRRKAIEKYINDKVVAKIHKHEEDIQISKIYKINAWKFLEERMLRASETERTRVKALNQDYIAKRHPTLAKAKVEGETKAKSTGPKPKDKREAAISVLMTLGYSREEATEKVDNAPSAKKG